MGGDRGIPAPIKASGRVPLLRFAEESVVTMILEDPTAIAIATAWGAAIYAVVEVAKRPLPRRSWPILPLVVGGLSGPTVVEFMLASGVAGVEGFPILHSIVVGVAAGAMASKAHEMRERAQAPKDET